MLFYILYIIVLYIYIFHILALLISHFFYLTPSIKSAPTFFTFVFSGQTMRNHAKATLVSRDLRATASLATADGHLGDRCSTTDEDRRSRKQRRFREDAKVLANVVGIEQCILAPAGDVNLVRLTCLEVNARQAQKPAQKASKCEGFSRKGVVCVPRQ